MPFILLLQMLNSLACSCFSLLVDRYNYYACQSCLMLFAFFTKKTYLFSLIFVESRSEFLEKLQRARSQVKPSTSSQPILSMPGPSKLTVGNWSLTCLKDGEIAIHNSDGQQATILKEDLPGFVFESNRGTKHSFTAETSLGKCCILGKRNSKENWHL